MIYYIDRATGEKKQEKVYGEKALRFLYKRSIGRCFAKIIAHLPILSHLYGWWQSLPFTKRKVRAFVETFQLNVEEFAESIDTYRSFNAFFTRKLKPQARPIADTPLVLPADGRYLFYKNIEKADGFLVKGKKFNLSNLLQNERLAEQYREGSMILARLCPTDYHRFHFPCDCVPGTPRLINGPLFSVNPAATKRNIEILAENKRVITPLETEWGRALYIEVGATYVGSIHQTFTPEKPAKKGEEKGFFSFGGSSLILLFPPEQISIDPNLLKNSEQHLETLCLFGQPT